MSRKKASPGATPEQIEAAADVIDRFYGGEGGAESYRLAEHVLAAACPPDHRIIRVGENRLTPELRAALQTVCADEAEWELLGQALDVIEAALAESEP